MYLQETAPHARLTSVVHSYLQIHASQASVYPVIPDGAQSVFLSAQSLQINSAFTQTQTINISQAGEYFGIRFFPGALRHFDSLDLSEMRGLWFNQEFFQQPLFQQLSAEVYEKNSFEQRANICDKRLLKYLKLRPLTKFDHALRLIYRSHGSLRIHQLARQLSLSTRHLNRLFCLHTGLSTKAFSQIMRIQQASQQLFNAPDSSLNSVFELNYSDQSHLIKDFQKFFGQSPIEFCQYFMSDFYNTRLSD